jgi:SAM-dependent methyltransferase
VLLWTARFSLKPGALLSKKKRAVIDRAYRQISYTPLVAEWWQTFFDDDYLRIWEGAEAPGKTEAQVSGLWNLLGLTAGSNILDAPCGYGRISRALAERGARVLGVDFSADLLQEAERRRGDIASDRLSYARHDLRTPLGASGFDAALNIFSSLGYGVEADDIAILSTLRNAVRPGGLVFVETNQRDATVVKLYNGSKPSGRLPDGTLLVEEVKFDPVAGRVESTWYWSGPNGSGEKHASIRLYTATELVRLLEAAGLRLRSAHNGCSPEPFVATGAGISGRLGLLAVRD